MSRKKVSEEKRMHNFLYVTSKVEQCKKLQDLYRRYCSGETMLDYALLAQIDHLKATYSLTEVQIDDILFNA